MRFSTGEAGGGSAVTVSDCAKASPRPASPTACTLIFRTPAAPLGGRKASVVCAASQPTSGLPSPVMSHSRRRAGPSTSARTTVVSPATSGATVWIAETRGAAEAAPPSPPPPPEPPPPPGGGGGGGGGATVLSLRTTLMLSA